MTAVLTVSPTLQAYTNVTKQKKLTFVNIGKIYILLKLKKKVQLGSPYDCFLLIPVSALQHSLERVL